MKVRKGSINYYLLSALEKTVEGVLLLGNLSSSAQMRDLLGFPDYPQKPAFLMAINRLKKRGLIEQEINRDGQILLKLTSLGKDFLGNEEVWDGKFRIVIWDIPEKRRVVRNLFRRKLKEWDFKNWQRSVWISKKNVTSKLKQLIQELELDEQIAVIESDDPSLANIKLYDRPS